MNTQYDWQTFSETQWLDMSEGEWLSLIERPSIRPMSSIIGYRAMGAEAIGHKAVSATTGSKTYSAILGAK